MDAESRAFSKVELTEAALIDLAGVDNATAAIWGEPQAEKYLAFLTDVLNRLATDSRLGTPLSEYPDLLVYTAKIVARRSAYGHRIFFRPIPGGIRVIRILHTAMNWPDHLEKEKPN